MIKCFCLRQKPTKHTVNYASFFSLPPLSPPCPKVTLADVFFKMSFSFTQLFFSYSFFSLSIFNYVLFFFHHTQAAVNEFKDRRALTLFAYFSRHSPIFWRLLNLIYVSLSFLGFTLCPYAGVVFSSYISANIFILMWKFWQCI